MELRFGAMQKPIANQLKEQGYQFEKDKAETWQALSHSVSMCCIHGLISDGDRDKAFNRLYKKIENYIKKHNK